MVLSNCQIWRVVVSCLYFDHFVKILNKYCSGERTVVHPPYFPSSFFSPEWKNAYFLTEIHYLDVTIIRNPKSKTSSCFEVSILRFLFCYFFNLTYKTFFLSKVPQPLARKMLPSSSRIFCCHCKNYLFREHEIVKRQQKHAEKSIAKRELLPLTELTFFYSVVISRPRPSSYTLEQQLDKTFSSLLTRRYFPAQPFLWPPAIN